MIKLYKNKYKTIKITQMILYINRNKIIIIIIKKALLKIVTKDIFNKLMFFTTSHMK